MPAPAAGASQRQTPAQVAVAPPRQGAFQGLKCSHCGANGHSSDNCWRLHPEKRPNNGAPGPARPNVARMIHYGHDRDLVSHIRDGLNPGSMFVDTRVGGVLVKGTLDTGAAVSVLHESVFRDMSEEIRNSPMPRPGSLTTATGTPIPILGCVDVIVRL